MKAQELADESRLLGFVLSLAAPRLVKGGLQPSTGRFRADPLFLLVGVAASACPAATGQKKLNKEVADG